MFIFPMLFLYEMMCWIQFAGMSAEIRNGADVFLRQFIMGFGKHSESIYGLLLIIVFFGIIFFNRNITKMLEIIFLSKNALNFLDETKFPNEIF